MRSSGVRPLDTIKQRADFLRAARALKAVRPGLVLQVRARAEDGDQPGPARVGYTASKKVGNSVARNRARRRLRAAVHDVLSARAKPGHDYVLIARFDTATRPYDALCNDLAEALERATQSRSRGPRPKKHTGSSAKNGPSAKKATAPQNLPEVSSS
jgi:ribonuclease P protein component